MSDCHEILTCFPCVDLSRSKSPVWAYMRGNHG